jgi:dienelactone hydrolase
MLAPAGGFSAASVNYGMAAKDVYSESFMDAARPIVGSYGAKDRATRGTGERLEQVLMAAGVEHDIKTYPDAGHSFLNDHDSADNDHDSQTFLLSSWCSAAHRVAVPRAIGDRRPPPNRGDL